MSDDPLLQIGLPQNLVDLKFNINTRGRVSSVDAVRSVPEDDRVARKRLGRFEKFDLDPPMLMGKLPALETCR